MEQEQTPSLRQIYLLGALRVYKEGSLYPLSGEKLQSLLAYLVLYPRLPHHREKLSDMLFMDAPFDRVRRNFSDTLYRLQKALGSDWFVIEADTVALQVDPHLWVDVWEFERLTASDREADLQKAVDLYAGDLLPELYDDWLLSERELRRNQYLSTLEYLAACQEERGELRQALLTLRRLVSVEPLHEPAHQAYLRLLGRMQRYGEALAHYEYLRTLMRSELDSEPLAETRLIAQSIEYERDLATVQTVVEERLPFTGRKPERVAALTAVEAMLNGQGAILAIEGEAGIGKSRLLREIATGVRWRGATMLQGLASEIPGASPFSPLVEALAPLINGPRGIQLETLLADETLAALAPLNPAWKEKAAVIELPPDLAGNRYYDALRPLGEALARLTPFVLALDDLQWADPALWKSLDVLAQSLARCGALVIVNYRRPEIETTSGWEVVQAWDRAGLLQTIFLHPLTVEEVAQLTGNQLQADPHEVHALTGGNPFLIGEWLAEPEMEQPAQRSIIAHTLPKLPSVTRRALECASVIGENIPYELWVNVVDVPPLVLANISDEMTIRNLLQPSAAGYSFVHDLIRTAVYNEIDPVRRRDFHARTARTYHMLEPENARLYAFHLDRAGLDAEAATAYRRAGEQDLKRFAYREAQVAFERALDLLSRASTLERIEIDIALARVCEITGDRIRQHPALNEALEGVHQLGNEALMLQTLLAMGRASSRMGHNQEAESQLTAALSLAQKLQDHSRESQAILFIGDLSGMQGKWEVARGYYIRALTLTQAIPDPAREASALRGIAIAARQMGDPQESVKWLEQGIALNRRIGDRLGEMTTQVNILGTLYELGAWDRLIAVADKAIPEAEAMGNRPSLARMRHNRGLAARALGDYETARQLLVLAERDSETMGDFRLGGLVRNTLGLVAEDEGNFQEALHLYRTALANAEAIQAATEIAYAQHDLGALILRLGQPLEAILLLEASREAWSGQENLLLRIKSEAFLGLALLAAGERARADELVASGWAAFQAGVPIGEQPQGWLWALYCLLTAFEQFDAASTVLRAAYAELQRQGRAIADHELRRSFFERVPLNRDIVKAYNQLADIPRVFPILLARREAPLGRLLREDEYISVQWTVSAPEDEAIADKTERRQHRLKRLLQEAEMQNAAPTDEDLAQALGVSRRTILRDMQALAQEIPSPPTRKRKQ